MKLFGILAIMFALLLASLPVAFSLGSLGCKLLSCAAPAVVRLQRDHGRELAVLVGFRGLLPRDVE